MTYSSGRFPSGPVAASRSGVNYRAIENTTYLYNHNVEEGANPTNYESYLAGQQLGHISNRNMSRVSNVNNQTVFLPKGNVYPSNVRGSDFNNYSRSQYGYGPFPSNPYYDYKQSQATIGRRIKFNPRFCINSVCDQGKMDMKLPDGNSVGHYLMRNRLMTNASNNLPYYDTWDPSIMWMKPNDYDC